MRVCVRTSDNFILESQSGGDEAHLEALLENARAAGYADDEVAVSVVDDAAFQQLLAAQLAAESPAEPTKAELLAKAEALLAQVRALAG